MEILTTSGAPKAIGPYSQGIKEGRWIFASGQVPLDPATGKLVEGDFEAKVRRVFANLRAVLASGGAEFRHVVKATVFLKSMTDFAALNAVYSEELGGHKPARSTVAVAGLPLDAPVEIELIAIV